MTCKQSVDILSSEHTVSICFECIPFKIRKRERDRLQSCMNPVKKILRQRTKSPNRMQKVIAKKSMSGPKGMPSPDIKWSMKGARQAVFSKRKPGGTAT